MAKTEADGLGLAGSKLGELLADKLQGGETIECWFSGMIRAGAIMWVPIIGTVFDALKRYYIVVRTNKRLILVQLAKPFFLVKEKRTHCYDLDDVKAVTLKTGMTTSTVSIDVADGTRYFFKDVDENGGAAFSSLFNPSKQ
jgi:hypothetical protein